VQRNPVSKHLLDAHPTAYCVYQLIQHSWATSTKQTYAAGIKRFISFCLEKGIVTPCSSLLPATEITLLCWAFIPISFLCNCQNVSSQRVLSAHHFPSDIQYGDHATIRKMSERSEMPEG
jgi:hypothetical protein